MHPSALAKSGTEHGHQAAVFSWSNMAMRFGIEAADDADMYKPKKDKDAPPLAQVKYGTANAVPELRWLHAIGNGGSRGDNATSRAIRGGQMKAEGVKAGVADCFLPVRRGVWPGLYIEMKKPSVRTKSGEGGLSVEQKEFRDFVQSQGYGWVVCYDWMEAVAIIKQYLATV